MTEQEHTNLALAKTFLAAVERGAVDDELAVFMVPTLFKKMFPQPAHAQRRALPTGGHP